MPSFYAAANVFVLPTAYETFSLVCMEAMACSLPVFATPVGGIEDYLRDGVNGYQIKLEAEDIACRLKAALDHSELMSKLREGARNTAVAYSWDRIGLEYIDMLKEIDAGKRRATSPAVPLQA